MRFAAFAVCLGLAVPAQAGFLDSLFGQKAVAVDCAIKDRACILHTAEDMIYAYARNREVEQNKGFTARLARIYWLLPDAERASFVTRLTEFDADDPADLMFDFTDYQARYKKTAPVDLDVLEQVLQTQTTPDGSKFGDFILGGFQSLLGTDDEQAALDLWHRESDVIWRKGQRTFRHLQFWLALNDPESFVFHTRNFYIAGRHRSEVTEQLSLVAAQHCQIGNTGDGLSVLKPLYKQVLEYNHKDLAARAYTVAELYRAVLNCEGTESAASFKAEIDALAAAGYASIKANIEDPEEQKGLTEFVQRRIEFSTNRILATRLYRAGKFEEARKVFEAGQATVGVFGTTTTAEGDVVLTPSLDRAPMRWESFTYDADRDWVRSHGSVSLPIFVADYTFDLDKKYGPDDNVEDFVDALSDVWPSELAQHAAAKLMTYAMDLSQTKPDRYTHYPDQMRLDFGMIAQSPACTYSDDTLQAMLDLLPSYKFADQRYNMLIDYVRYLDRAEAAKPTDGDGLCLLDRT